MAGELGPEEVGGLGLAEAAVGEAAALGGLAQGEAFGVGEEAGASSHCTA